MPTLICILILLSAIACSAAELPTPNALRIQPWAGDPHYWQYQGKPVLLLGGSKDDNLFQIPDLQEHLDLLASVGGNYIRNTMSDRVDKGFEVYPFKQLPDGKYDLMQDNEEYWRRFSELLRLTYERDIIIQIEVWDRFDYSRDNWTPHPYNPKNNVNYTVEQSGLGTDYPKHPASDEQPFFHTIPGMPRYEPRLEVVRAYQERFVERMLSHSLDYGNVLYCMNNETSTPVEWGQYWMKFIRGHAAQRGLTVCVTDMFDDVFKPETSAHLRVALDHPELYDFLDISQTNSRTFGEDQWERLTWIRDAAAEHPRPRNNTKIYSDGQTGFGSGTPKDGVERFWRHLIAGAASCRFHRPTSGIGLNEISQACIRAARKVESLVRLWDLETHQELLTDRERNAAYLAAESGKAYVLFMTDGGNVGLNLTGDGGVYSMKWVDISSGDWGPEATLTGGGTVAVSAPNSGPWAAAIVRQ